ncbi:MAG: tetratricopeptide repeat protein [Myxococcota bacterium]
MEKTVKLQRYDRKDYTELVDFPVEIVGRDGVVRRYTFEDSIRLYQRRINFAPIRYRDGDLVRAEVNHCRSRIDQLRRSYFHRYGWGTPDGHAAAEERFGDLAGELAAFMCRVLGVQEGRPDLRFEEVCAEADGTSTWYLTPEGARSGMLLYFHRFDGTSADLVRDRFFASLKQLERSGRGSGDAERLLAFHHTVDCGFVLTGRGADYASFVQPKEETPQPVDLAPTPWDELLEIIRKGDYEGALRRCREIVREQPWHRSAYVAGAMLAGYLGEHLQGEDLAQIGVKYFPKDGVLLYYLGMCRLRLGRSESAEVVLGEALEASPDLVSARALLSTHLVQAGRTREALALLRARAGIVPDDRRAEADLAVLEHAILWRRVSVVTAASAVVAGLLALVLAGGWIGPIALVFGTACWAGGLYLFRRQVDALVDRQRFEEISQGLRRLHRRARGAPVIS